MTKRKQPELAADRQNDVVIDTSDFGSFKKVKGYWHALPISKVAGGRKFYDLFTLVDVPRRRRSVRGGGRGKEIAVRDAGNREGSNVKASSKSWDVRKKPKAETRDSEVICTRSLSNGRQLRRLRVSTAKGQKLRKLGNHEGSIAKESSKSRDVRNKPTAENDSEVICTSSLGNGRLSRRLRVSTTKGQKLGKLGNHEGNIVMESSKARDVRNKPTSENDSEVTCTGSLGNGRQSRRLRVSTTKGQKLGMLGNHEGRKVKESRKSRDARSKPTAEGDPEVICAGSLGNGRLSRRMRGCTSEGQKLGKLSSEKFEIHIENIWRKLSKEKKNEFTYLDSLWFSLYAKEPHKAKVLSWIKKKDIFSKKYVFVPIVQWGHWFLLIFCHFGESARAKSKRRCMLLLDSLQKANSKQLESGIRRFVFDIFKTEERPESKELIRKLPLLIPKVPQQKNGSPHFMKEDWFTPEDVECFVELLASMTKSSDCSD